MTTIDRYDILFVLLGMLIVYLTLAWRKSLPSTSGLHDLVDLVNTKGGIIIVLWVTSMIFFGVGMKVLFWSTNRMIEGKISTDNAMVLTCFNWISGSCFGGAFGAMIKTMTGDDLRHLTRSTDVPPPTPPGPDQAPVPKS
jgi:hypothetical protein